MNGETALGIDLVAEGGELGGEGKKKRKAAAGSHMIAIAIVQQPEVVTAPGHPDVSLHYCQALTLPWATIQASAMILTT